MRKMRLSFVFFFFFFVFLFSPFFFLFFFLFFSQVSRRGIACIWFSIENMVLGIIFFFFVLFFFVSLYFLFFLLFTFFDKKCESHEKKMKLYEKMKEIKQKNKKNKEISAYTSDRVPDRMPGCISIRLVDRMPAEYVSDRI